MDNSLSQRSRYLTRLRLYAARFGRAHHDTTAITGGEGAAPGPRWSERGQALILVALAMVVLLAFVGLTTDVGQLFIYMGHLRRSTDAASLAAAAQYRESRSNSSLEAAAKEVMNLNGIDPTTYTVTVQTCETNPSDPQLCTTPRRKLIRVISNLEVPMTFLNLVGIHTVRISANSIGEAAALDVVLVIDISESMAWDDENGDRYTNIADRDPHACNYTDPGGTDGYKGECHPFEEVKEAASRFVERILDKPIDDEEDRVTIVTFSNGYNSDPNLGTHYRPYTSIPGPLRERPTWMKDVGQVKSVINDLLVFDPPSCPEPPNNTIYGPCRKYEAGSYAGFNCNSCRGNVIYHNPPSPDVYFWGSPITFVDTGTDSEYSSVPTTNVGGGLLLAGRAFEWEQREDALWVVVLLTDGIANATDLKTDTAQNITQYSTYPLGFCPYAAGPSAAGVPTICIGNNVTTRHASGNALYDPGDYARDMADYVGCKDPLHQASSCNGVEGQSAVIFSIGLGDSVLDSGGEVGGRPYGATLLRYIARVGYMGDPGDPPDAGNIDPCAPFATQYNQSCGNYFFAPRGQALMKVFEEVASRIFTRLVH